MSEKVIGIMRLALILSISGLLIPASVTGQELAEESEEEPESSDGEEVRVRTTSSSPLDNPIEYQPMESFDELELQRRSSNSFGEMLDGTPGVAMRSFGAAPSRPVIRGLGGERVLVLHNGERMGDVASTAHDHAIGLDPLAAQRIEVVRGPASLLYGSSALGGVVNLMDERIPREWDDGFYGDAAIYGATGQLTGATSARVGYGAGDWVAQGRLSYRLAGDLGTPEGRLPDTGLQGSGGDLGASMQHNSGLFGLAMGVHDLDYGLPEALDDPDERVEIRSRRFFAQAVDEREFDGFFYASQVRVHAAHYNHEEIEIEPGPSGALEEELELSYRTLSASSTLTMRHGELGFISRGALGAQVGARNLAMGGEEILAPDAREAFLAVFLFEEIPAGEHVHFQFGLRPEVHFMAPHANEAFAAPDESRISPTFSGSLGLNVQPASFLEVGAQVARAHRVPIVEELYSNATHLGTGQFEIGDPDLNNEVGYGADLYARLKWSRLELEAAGFYNSVDDFIFLDPTGENDEASGYPIYRYDAAPARLWGGELSLVARPWRGILLGGAVDYVRGERLEPTLQDLPNMPPLRSRIQAGWDSENYWSLATVRLAAAQERTAPEEATTDGYALLGFEGGFRFHGTGSHILSLRVDNALNTAYRDHLSRVGGRATPMPGRSLHATYRWIY